MINNIFSKKIPITNNTDYEHYSVIVDNRERNSLVPSELLAHNFKIEYRQLLVADYIVKDVAIERKTESDFIGSIINKRIWRQLEEIKQYEKCLIIVEKEPNKKRTIHSPQMKGALIKIAIDYNVPILFSSHPKETAHYLYMIASKQEKITTLNPGKKYKSKWEQSLFILESFQNIGGMMSSQLLKKFKSLKNIFNASESELTKTLGRKTKEFIRQLN